MCTFMAEYLPKAKIKNTFVFTLATGWDFFPMIRMGYVTYDVYLDYSSDIANVTLVLFLFRMRSLII